MADRKLTLFEIHLDEATFTANATKGGESSLSQGEETDAGDEDAAAGGCPGKSAAKLLLVLLVLAAVALGAKRLLAGDIDEELEDLADLDEA